MNANHLFAQDQEEFIVSQMCDCIEQSELKDHLGKSPYSGEFRHDQTVGKCFLKHFTMEVVMSMNKDTADFKDPEQAQLAAVKQSTRMLRILQTQCRSYREMSMLAQLEELSVDRAEFILTESKKRHVVEFSDLLCPCFDSTSIVKIKALEEHVCMQQFETFFKPTEFDKLNKKEQIVAIGIQLSRNCSDFKEAYGRDIELQLKEEIERVKQEEKQPKKPNPSEKFESRDYKTSCECLDAISLNQQSRSIEMNVEDCLITAFVRHFRAGNRPDERKMNTNFLVTKMTVFDFVNDEENHSSKIVKQFYDCTAFQEILEAASK